MTEDEMVGCHHRLNGHEFKQTQEDSKGQGSLVCCSLWGCKESDRHDLPTEQQQYSACLKLLMSQKLSLSIDSFFFKLGSTYSPHIIFSC